MDLRFTHMHKHSHSIIRSFESISPLCSPSIRLLRTIFADFVRFTDGTDYAVLLSKLASETSKRAHDNLNMPPSDDMHHAVKRDASKRLLTADKVNTNSDTALCCAVLCCAVLCCAVLCCAVLCCAVLCCGVPCALCALCALCGDF